MSVQGSNKGCESMPSIGLKKAVQAAIGPACKRPAARTQCFQRSWVHWSDLCVCVCVLWGLATQLFPTLATEALLWGGPLNKFAPKRPWPPWPQKILISEAAREQNEGGLSNTVSNPVDELVHMTTDPWFFSVLAVVRLLGAESIAWLYEEAGCVVWEFNPETASWPPPNSHKRSSLVWIPSERQESSTNPLSSFWNITHWHALWSHHIYFIISIQKLQ